MILLNEQNFDKEVINGGDTWLVDFWATWCRPCLNCPSVLEEFQQKYSGVKIGRVNIEENSDLASQYTVIAVPTFIFFRKGNAVKKVVGLHSAEYLGEVLEALKNA